MADLNKRGNAKASAARKLSAIRAFGRYLRREGVIDSDPAALVGTPRRETRIRTISRSTRCRSSSTRRIPRVRSAAATRRSWSSSTPPGCASASWSDWIWTM
jgi:site-specific recombinase XerC